MWGREYVFENLNNAVTLTISSRRKSSFICSFFELSSKTKAMGIKDLKLRQASTGK